MLTLAEELYIADDLPILFDKALNSIVLSDVHIGYEEELAKKGVFLPHVQKKRFLDLYKRAVNIFSTKNIIINGDMKHIFEKLGRTEREELTEIFKFLKEDGANVMLVLGNHDNYITIVTDKYDNIQVTDELRTANRLYMHGHKEVSSLEKYVIIGHEHPRLSMRDRIGYARKMPCFLKVPRRDGGYIIVLPSLGLYQSGNDITLSHSSFLSPIMRKEAMLVRAKPFVIIESQGIMEFPELGVIADLIS
ncbi:phosphoesterase [Sulfolobales archaeon HS-7]|nr:phosphoesterase [Sulfolobales archaeon HS-7]